MSSSAKPASLRRWDSPEPIAAVGVCPEGGGPGFLRAQGGLVRAVGPGKRLRFGLRNMAVHFGVISRRQKRAIATQNGTPTLALARS